MNLKVEIKRNADGAIVSAIKPESDYSEYFWEEGNGSCDCNRENMFLSATGVDFDFNKKTECGDDRYSVRITNVDTSEVLYNEFE